MHTVLRSQWRGYLSEILSDDVRSICQNKLDYLVKTNILLGAAIYQWNQNLFVYLESIDVPVFPQESLEELNPFLSQWPGSDKARNWIEMIDVFHFNEPQSLSHWERKSPVESRVGKIGLLKPDMVASYIYYHYGLQEERTFSGDKYEIIALHENILFGYFEYPAVCEEPFHKPRLTSKSMPEDWSQACIPDHFYRWSNFDRSLLPMKLWVSSWKI